MNLETGKADLQCAYRAGVILVTGSDAGNLLVFHGPTVHRGLRIWNDAGIPEWVGFGPPPSIQRALLHARESHRLDRKCLDADLLIVDCNPIEDIHLAERIWARDLLEASA